ncbi:MAG: DEAD/DEAH box helicase [Limisphaerales bacterium]
MPFTKLGLSKQVVDGVKAMGYADPTPIQLRAIPLIMEGRDVIGSAQTGTGKTAAFALPILSKLESKGRDPKVLVLVPTRELAAQMETAWRDFARFSKIRVGLVYGGTGYGKQNKMFESGVDILIATPGRLLDHMQQGNCRLGNIEWLVLDEADRMLDMGFLPDVKQIIGKCGKKRQTMLFSATIPPKVDYLIKHTMDNPEVVEIGARRSPAETVEHNVYPVNEDQKVDLLQALLTHLKYDSIMIFCRTKIGAEKVGNMLKRENHAVAILHSNRTQSDREKALNGFRDGRFEVLVATDIAARGLDIQQVSHVINFDVPQHPEDYVHRIGRTGRAQSSGDALTLMVASDSKHMESIERFIGQSIPRKKLDTFDYKYTALFDEGKRGKGQIGRSSGGRVVGGFSFGGGGGKRRGGRRRRR